MAALALCLKGIVRETSFELVLTYSAPINDPRTKARSRSNAERSLRALIVAVQRIGCNARKLPFDQVAAAEIDLGSPEKI